MIELRLKTRVPEEELKQKVGKIVTDDDFNLLLTRAAKVQQPDGRLLCVYLPGVLKAETDPVWETLSKIRVRTDNRGQASGGARRYKGAKRVAHRPVYSTLLGGIDPIPGTPYCRLTAYTAKQANEWEELRPLFQAMASQFRSHVPDRYKAQETYCDHTHEDWTIPGTPFSTITINNTYPTGVHTDKGDLDEGFSCLGVARRGDWSGGILTFPEFRVGVDLQDGDMILMDAHQWHGNTAIVCSCGASLGKACADCGAERVSIVSYFRTKLTQCGSLAQEEAKREASPRGGVKATA